MVEYPGAGLVVLHSYMCPMSLALGAPGGRRASSDSLHTAASAAASGAAEGPAAEGLRARPRSSGLDPLDSDGEDGDDHDDDDDDGEEEEGQGGSPNAPPMLIGTVVAPRAEDLREARRAAARLERIARVFQTEWVVEGGGGGGVAW